MFSDNVPNNAFHVMCGNCMTRFNYKDIQEYDDAIKLLIKESDTLQKELDMEEDVAANSVAGGGIAMYSPVLTMTSKRRKKFRDFS